MYLPSFHGQNVPPPGGLSPLHGTASDPGPHAASHSPVPAAWGPLAGLAPFGTAVEARRRLPPAQPAGPALPAEFSACVDALAALRDADDLAPLVERLCILGRTAGFDMHERYPETLYYLRHPHAAGPADCLGRRALGLSALVAALGHVGRGHAPLAAVDLARLQQILPALFAQGPPPDPAEAFADAPHRLRPAVAGGAEARLRQLALALADTPDAARRIGQSMALYVRTFAGLGPRFEALMHTLPVAVLRQLLQSIHLYGRADPQALGRWMFERDLLRVDGRNPHAAHNAAILGCAGSFLASPAAASAGLLRADHHACFDMRVALCLRSGDICYPRIFDAALPDFSDEDQPDVHAYVHAGRLCPAPYAQAVETLFELFREAVARERPQRVVLSAPPVGDFPGGLPASDRQAVQELLLRQMAFAAERLQQAGLPVVFAGRAGEAALFLADLNDLLRSLGAAPLPAVGSIPGDWLHDGDLVFHGGTRLTCGGNGCFLERGSRGDIGGCSTLHPIHALACCCHALSAASPGTDTGTCESRDPTGDQGDFKGEDPEKALRP